MAEVAPISPASAGKLAANQAVIVGRIKEVKRSEKAVYTDVILPAPDQFSSPQTVRIVSSRLLGKPNEDLTQRVVIKGYSRKYTNPETGEKGTAVDVKLSAIEE